MKLLGTIKPLIGVVHLAPLPGAPGYGGSLDRIVRRALADARAYLDGGIDALLVENYGDAPFHAGPVPPATVAALTLAASRIRELGGFPLGVNVLRSDGPAALAVAAASGAQFIRVNVLAGAMVTDQGIVQGCAARLMRERAVWGGRVAVWADVLVKHAHPVAPLEPEEAAADLVERALADALIVTGKRTGAAVDPRMLAAARRGAGRAPVLAGSGVDPETLADLWALTDGFIVGTALKQGGRTAAAVDPRRVAKLVGERRRLASLQTEGLRRAGARRRTAGVPGRPAKGG
jgi:membrane complex biogenesis BtpA family protein